MAFLGYFLLQHARTTGGTELKQVSTVARAPILVELFTSEGCSDCPPADALLQKLDKSQPVSDAQLIVLSEHVDYWDGIGWKDPFSSHDYSLRQSAYAGHFGLASVYTPQMVVDGRFELVGSDERGALRAIQDAAKAEKVPLTLSAVRFADGETIRMQIDVGPVPSHLSDRSGRILVAVADESDQSNVRSGENSGRFLKHVAVVRQLSVVEEFERGGTFSREVAVKFNPARKGSWRLVTFVQDRADGSIWGVGSANLSN